MNILFDQDQLLRLVTNLYLLTGIRANILDAQGRDICLAQDHPPFCRAVNSQPEGHRRCVACDMRAAAGYCQEAGFQFYRCHAGVCEAVMPLYNGSQPLAYLIFGGFLSEAPLPDQWARASAGLDWYPGGPEALRAAFFQLRQYSAAELNAYAELLESLAAYIRLRGMISTAERTDLQKLDAYLDQHYREKLSLASISAQLHIGRTKLCRLAKELSGGATLTSLITRRRVEAAQKLLLETDAPISAVAEAVGISDYNYFSRVFRAAAGTTPREFRAAGRRQGQNLG
ncbi:MAG: PocR ligand-binding domain-containing protein [Oscillospiraceae bacterium]|nr:PocR ligand-binding domain-containing protein [Oscillospiraceae bacterium]